MEDKAVATDPRGRSFLSYKRSRREEGELLLLSQRERGVPTWQDIHNLNEEHATSALRSTLEESTTANAILWITPDVADSSVIRRVEAPTIMRRAQAEDHFFVVPVAAGGLDYEGASKTVGREQLGLVELAEWNIHRVANDPANQEDARRIANRVLHRRLEAIDDFLPKEERLRIGFFVRALPPARSELALSIDWTHRFKTRHAPRNVWDDHLQPAIKDIVSAIEKHAPNRRVTAQGRPTISAAFALGRGLMAPLGIRASWLQYTPSSGETPWSLEETPEESGFKASIRDSNTNSEDLTVLLSVSAPVEHAWARTQNELPAFRGVVHVHPGAGQRVEDLSPGQALDVVQKTVEAIRKGRNQFLPGGVIHFFMAAPVGMAFLLGQLSNTLGPLRLYEHQETDAVGRYIPGPVFRE